ncbi:hypothetical protein ACQEVB_09655 [Pseudonocardia sp. CA-107938]|uniref:hypothetical protein n=1 Tax=Pseudonocardia sp. CA-107938 TaxID=3240021 RepID=UPI003D8DC910
MTIESAPAAALPVTRPLPLAAPTAALPVAELPAVPRWQVWAAVAAGLLGGALMVVGVALPW